MHTDENNQLETFDFMDIDIENASPESVVLLRPPVHGTARSDASPSYVRSPSPVASHVSEGEKAPSRSNRKGEPYGLESKSLLVTCVEQVSQAPLKLRRLMYQLIRPSRARAAAHYSYSERVVACLAQVPLGWLHHVVCSRRAAGRHTPAACDEDGLDSPSTEAADDPENSDTDAHAAIVAGLEVDRIVDTHSVSDTTLRNLIRIALGEASYGSGSG